jgi:hypothetical protein
MRTLAPRIWGFDMRVTGEAHLRAAAWLGEDAHGYPFLLKRGIDLPMSVDSTIWPSIFSYRSEGEANLPEQVVVDKGVASINCEDELWTDLALMKAYAASNRTNGLVVAIEIYVPPDADVDEVPSSRLFLNFKPMKLPSQFQLLGFDVAGVTCVSGMLSCCYDNAERSTLMPFWSSRINEHGLISTYSDAVVFRRLTEERSDDPDPFFVFALYVER